MAKDLSQVKRGYDRWALVYDHDANPLPALEEPVVKRLAGEVNQLNILDLGCGTGRHAIWLAQAGACVTAVDFSEGMLAEARKKTGAEKIHFIVHDVHQKLPLEDAIIDLIISGLVLEHVCNLPEFFAEVCRVLKPDGRAILSTMHPAMFLKGSQARFTDPISGELVQPGSIAHSISDFIMGALQAGLELNHIEESKPDADFVRQYPRAEKYLDWPMLAVFSFKRHRVRS
ncbi:MAG: class I SAM-dependent methyltransferase [Planctomycetia bacterium]|nr:class I SAM-dependent methyltransferase [Planctomycetia bacterium]